MRRGPLDVTRRHKDGSRGLLSKVIVLLLSVWVLTINPMWLAYPGYLLTHGVNTCAITWGMYFLWKWVNCGANRFGILAGLLLGFSATVRPTSAMMAIVVGIAIIKKCRDNYGNHGINQGLTNSPVVRSIGILVLSYLVFALVIISFNWIHFVDFSSHWSVKPVFFENTNINLWR